MMCKVSFSTFCVEVTPGALSLLGGVIEMTEDFGMWMESSETVGHIRHLYKSIQTGGHLAGWVVSAVLLVQEAVHVPPYDPRVPSVQ